MKNEMKNESEYLYYLIGYIVKTIEGFRYGRITCSSDSYMKETEIIDAIKDVESEEKTGFRYSDDPIVLSVCKFDNKTECDIYNS